MKYTFNKRILIISAMLLRMAVFSEEESNIPKVEDSYIVLAHVVSIQKEEGEMNRAILEISHVFRGPERFKSEKFSVMTGQWGWNFSVPNLKLNEEAIWCVVLKNEELQSKMGERYGMHFPVRKIYNTRYEQNVKLAGYQENYVEILNQQEKVDYLKQGIGNRVDEISAWSIRELASFNDDEIHDFLYAFIDPSELSVIAKLKLDEVLAEIKREKWFYSIERFNYLGSVVSQADVQEFESREICGYFGLLMQTNDGKLSEKVFHLADELLKQRHIDPNTRMCIFRSLRRYIRKEKFNDRVFDIFVREIQSDRNGAEYAAYHLQNNFVLDEKKKEMIRNLQKQTENGAVLKIINEILENK